MSKRPTMGSNPLDALVSGDSSSAVSQQAGRRSRETGASKSAPPRRGGVALAAAPAARERKVRATFHVPADLVEEARSAVIALAGPPLRLTLAALVESALRRELDRLKKAHNDGKSWPRATAPLVGGRPIR